MNLNRKGYLTVEVILASVVAISIAVFLMEITIKLVNVTDDAYVDTELLTDKGLIIKNIKENLEKDIERGGGIKKIELSNSSGREPRATIIFCKDNDYDNEIYYERAMYIYNNQFVYEENSPDEEIFYSKKLNDNLYNFNIASNPYGEVGDKEYVLFKITADSKFTKEPFEANIIVYNNKTC